MSSEDIRNSLFWCATEVIDKLTKVEYYIYSLTLARRRHNVLAHIEQYIELSRKLLGELLSKIANDNILPELPVPTLREIRKLNWLISNLIYGLTPAGLPKQRPELTYFLEELYSETPSITFIPTHNYEFIDYTFKPARERGGEIVGLPIISANLPELWVGLAHEVGHFNREELITKFTQRLSEQGLIDLNSTDKVNRIEEIYCDLFALSTIGPCYLTFHILESIIDRSIFSPLPLVLEEGQSPSHPTHMTRIQVMKTFLEKFIPYEDELLKDLIKVVDIIIDVDNKEEPIREQSNPVIADTFSEENNILSHKDEICHIIRDLISESQRYSLLRGKDIQLSMKLAEDLVKWEEEDGYYIPIGTIRKEQNIGKILQEIKKLKEKNEIKYSLNDLNNLFDKLEEEPVKMQVLFNAFQILRLKHMKSLIKSLEDVKNDIDVKKLVDNYKDKMIKRNEAFLKSIEMATICKFYKR